MTGHHLANDVGCDRTYVGRVLRLTSLAADIIEVILRGDEPDGLRPGGAPEEPAGAVG